MNDCINHHICERRNYEKNNIRNSSSFNRKDNANKVFAVI